ncbi:hypothetical protein BFZC1_18835 [Lysinibacillus fusiformis ZC1]|nr:hypothetical protein BFZC1_18835 [Lysinibacillus fusiformis ZC1]
MLLAVQCLGQTFKKEAKVSFLLAKYIQDIINFFTM